MKGWYGNESEKIYQDPCFGASILIKLVGFTCLGRGKSSFQSDLLGGNCGGSFFRSG
jgi:hypothetical protein